jgi:hypothetical protein
MIASKLSWTNQELFPVDIIQPWFSMFMYHMGMNNRPVGGRSSETWSHPTDITIIIDFRAPAEIQAGISRI